MAARHQDELRFIAGGEQEDCRTAMRLKRVKLPRVPVIQRTVKKSPPKRDKFARSVTDRAVFHDGESGSRDPILKHQHRLMFQ